MLDRPCDALHGSACSCVVDNREHVSAIMLRTGAVELDRAVDLIVPA